MFASKYTSPSIVPVRSVGEGEGFGVGEILGGEIIAVGFCVGGNVVFGRNLIEDGLIDGPSDGRAVTEDGFIEGSREGSNTVKDSEGDIEFVSVGLTDGLSDDVVAGGVSLKFRVTYCIHNRE